MTSHHVHAHFGILRPVSKLICYYMNSRMYVLAAVQAILQICMSTYEKNVLAPNNELALL